MSIGAPINVVIIFFAAAVVLLIYFLPASSLVKMAGKIKKRFLFSTYYWMDWNLLGISFGMGFYGINFMFLHLICLNYAGLEAARRIYIEVIEN